MTDRALIEAEDAAARAAATAALLASMGITSDDEDGDESKDESSSASSSSSSASVPVVRIYKADLLDATVIQAHLKRIKDGPSAGGRLGRRMGQKDAAHEFLYFRDTFVPALTRDLDSYLAYLRNGTPTKVTHQSVRTGLARAIGYATNPAIEKQHQAQSTQAHAAFTKALGMLFKRAQLLDDYTKQANAVLQASKQQGSEKALVRGMGKIKEEEQVGPRRLLTA